MPTFEYTALDKTGKQTRGNIAAESASAARKLLRSRHLHATKLRSIREASKVSGFSLWRVFSGRQKRIVLEFTRQLSTMIQADVKLTEALAVLITQTSDHKFAQVVQNIRDELLAGEALAESLKEYPNWFDQIYVAMIRVGEATGNLGRSLSLLADYMAKKHRLEAKLKSAFTYPAILIVMSIAVTIFLMTFLVPKISNIIISTGRELPAITQVLINISYVLTHYWFLIIGFLVLSWWLLQRFLRSGRGREAFDRFILQIPVTGELLRQSIVARFTSTLAALIRSGMPMADSLQVVAAVTGNSVMAGAIAQARERIIAGADISTPLQESKVVGPAVAHMIAVGEKSGELESMLLTIADSIEESTDISVQRISTIIEPLIIVFIAVFIGIIILGTVLPLLQAADVTSL